jgi:uncharacterized protein (DUF362 family)
MDTHLSRRSFLQKSALVGVGSLLGVPTLTRPASGASGVTGFPDLTEVTGRDYFKSTLAAVDQLGGMNRFVPKGARVGLLINDPFRNPGTHVNPEVALAVVKMCCDAGAKSVQSLKDGPRGYWQRTPLAKRYADALKSLTPCSGRYVQIGIRRAVSLKQAEIIRELMEADLLINVSISKDHAGTNFSGILKNMMGAATYSTCRYFHYGKGGWNEDIEFLSQCVADINSLRRPVLSVCDSTEFIVTNGPYGPGKIIKPQKVVAGADPVAVDTYCAGLLGLTPSQIGMIGRSAEFGLGEMNLGKLRIREISA